jgi:hypothetical protein
MVVLQGCYSGCQIWLLVVLVGLKRLKILIYSRRGWFGGFWCVESRTTRDVLESAASKAIDVLLWVKL